MKKSLLMITLSLMSTISFAGTLNEMISTNIDQRFEKTALSLIENSNVDSVELVDGRVVISLNNSNQYLDVKVNNGSDSFSKKQSLRNLQIPFPKKGDVVKCFENLECPSNDYLETLEKYGISQAAADTINSERIEFNFMKIKFRSLLKADQDIHVGFVLTPNGNSFDAQGNYNFITNGCDKAVCWGSRGITLKLKNK